MKIAFYCPLNPPDTPVPSGDRRIARAIGAAFAHAGHELLLTSRLRSLDIGGDPDRQRRLQQLGDRIAARIVTAVRALPRAQWPAAWLTYHLYHKAPDWLGPTVSRQLEIPYAVAEASYAPKRREGPWSRGLEEVGRALGDADLVLGFKSKDEACVRPLLKDGAQYRTMRPFLATAPWAHSARRRDEHRRGLGLETGLPLDSDTPWLLAVGMMRSGAKLRCYLALAESLALLNDRPWRLLVVGDGPERAAVRAALAPFGDRVRLLGRREGAALQAVYAAADILVWPAIKEPIGMVLVEAQATGLPVVAADRAAIDGVAIDGETGLLPPEGDGQAFAAAVDQLLADPILRRRLGSNGLRHTADRHDIDNAGADFVAALCDLTQPTVDAL